MAKPKTVQPMLASSVDLSRLDKLKWPLWVSPKLDGIRAIVHNGVVVSRTLKPIPSRFVQQMWGKPQFEGFDGELICGPPAYKNVYQNTFSAAMTHNAEQPLDFYVFDYMGEPGLPYDCRNERMNDILVETGVENNHIVIVPQHEAYDWSEVRQIEEALLSDGFEGVMLRNPRTEYKFGRSTFLEQALLKFKHFTDSDAVVTGAEEMLHNDNEAVVDARGLTTRTSHIANLRPSGLLGALLVTDVTTGIAFKIGTGFDMSAREMLWKMHLEGKLAGKILKYKFLDYGVVDAPRHPVFLNWRSPLEVIYG